MNPDSLVTDIATSIHMYVGQTVMLSIGALICVLVAVMSLAEEDKPRFKPKPVLISFGLLVLAAACITGGVFTVKDGLKTQPSEAANIDSVQEWAQSFYGVSVGDGEAKDMAEQITSRPDWPDKTYAIKGADGVLEVKLIAAEDGNFHMVQTSAELPLSRIGD